MVKIRNHPQLAVVIGRLLTGVGQSKVGREEGEGCEEKGGKVGDGVVRQGGSSVAWDGVEGSDGH